MVFIETAGSRDGGPQDGRRWRILDFKMAGDRNDGPYKIIEGDGGSEDAGIR